MSNPRKVAVLGYYGHLNAGDELLQHSLAHIFADGRLLFSGWFPGVDALNHADLVVIGGGSIWPDHSAFQLGTKLLRALKPPVMVVGISARREDPSTRASTLELIDRSIFFHVRDRATGDYFGNPPELRVGADLFWWSPWDGDNACGANGSAVAVNLQPWSTVAWNPAEVIDAISGAGYRSLAWPFHFGSDVMGPQNDSNLLRSLSMAVPASWTYQPALEARIVVAMRYHAIQVAIRLGRPVVGFDHHRKTRAFFLENGLNDLCVPLERPDLLRVALLRVESEFPRYVQRIRAIRDNLLDLGKRDLEACRAAFNRARTTARRETPLGRILRRFA